MGAKPWVHDAAVRATSDWEAELPAYKELESFWWSIRRGEVAPPRTFGGGAAEESSSSIINFLPLVSQRNSSLNHQASLGQRSNGHSNNASSPESAPLSAEARQMIAALESLATFSARSMITGYNLTADGSSWIIHARKLCSLSLCPDSCADAHHAKVFESSSFEQCRSETNKALWDPQGATVTDLWAPRPKERRTREAMNRDGSTITITENRWSQAYGKSYAYGGLLNEALPAEAHPLVPHLFHLASTLAPTAAPYDVALANWYRAEDSISAHSDNEPQLRARAPIFSFSWGAQRRFILKAKANADGSPLNPGALKLELVVGDGDLLVMGGATQETHRHLVPPPKAGKRARREFHPQGKAGSGSGEAKESEDPCSIPEGGRANITIRSSSPEWAM